MMYGWFFVRAHLGFVEIQDGHPFVFPVHSSQLVDLFQSSKSPDAVAPTNAPRAHRITHHIRRHGLQPSPQRFQVAQLGVEVQQRGVANDVGLQGVLPEIAGVDQQKAGGSKSS